MSIVIVKMIKTGIDIVYNKRFDKNLNDERFLERVFHASELKLKDKGKLAGIFALKEAVMKVLGKKTDWKDIEIKYDKNGKPEIKLSDNIKPENLLGIDGSVSHDGGYTLAVIIIELKLQLLQ